MKRWHVLLQHDSPCSNVSCACSSIIKSLSWRVWFARNEITHDKPLPSVEGSKRFLCSYIRTLRDIKSVPVEMVLKGKGPLLCMGELPAHASVKERPPDKPWLRPPSGWVKLSIDGSFRKEDGTAGIGMVLRDEFGAVIFSACRFLPSCEEALEAELLSCSEGLELALQHSSLPIIIDSDCLQLVSAIQDSSQDRSPYLHIIDEIKRLVFAGRVCNFVKVDRGQVRVSHCLANWARTELRTLVMFGSGPEIFNRELELEQLVSPNAQ